MQLLLDNLSALLVASSVLLLGIVARTDSSQVALEQTAHYASRAQVQSFTSWLEEDLTQIGENYGSGQTAFAMPTQSTSGLTRGMTTAFQFHRDSLRTVSGITTTYRVFVRYRLVSRGTVRVDNEPSPVPLFGVERDEQTLPVTTDSVTPTSGGWVRAGGGPGTLSQFVILPHDRDGQPTTDLTRTDFLRIRLSFVPPYDNEHRELHELHWGTTVGIRPF
ncbi:MAG TPA: hypothetical protein VF594_08765 [Rubricoccaceae bacterium]|jgi:hypothetical protein